MKKLYIFLILSILVLEGCNKGGNNNLQQKKDELNKAKKEFGSLKEKISGLEKEIAKLEGKAEQKGKPVLVENVSFKEYSHYIEAQGRVESDQHVDVNALYPGTIERVYVKEGDAVKKGQLLAEIDASTLASQIQGAQSQVELAKTMFEKQKRLRAQNIGTEVQYLQAKGQLESAEAGLQTLRNQYKNSKITSPINGVVDHKDAKEGATANTMFPMFSIVGGSGYKVVAQISEAYLPMVKRGLAVKVNFPAINQEVSGTISTVSQSIDAASRTFKVEVNIKDNQLIRPNLIAVVKINDYSNKKSIAVPVNSIQRTDEGEFVFVAKKKDDHYVASRKFITKGSTYGGKTEVVQGLTQGDLVVTTGFQDLVDDQPIKVKNL
jgi:RND family efflux transporter MFP subunit